MLFKQVCIDATPKHSSTGQGSTFLLFSAALQNRLSQQVLCHCNHTYGDLLFKQMYSDVQ